MSNYSVMRTPRKIDVSITSRCNLRCAYCYFDSGRFGGEEEISTHEWLTFWDELGRLSVMNVCLAGGEPFIRADLRELIEGIVKNRMRFSVLSNGGLITRQMACFLASTGRCNHVQISLDSFSPEEHDACRGKGSWEGAIRGLRLLVENQVNVAIRVTIHRYNYRNIDKTAKFILEDLGMPSFGTNSAGYIGNCRFNAHDVMLTVSEQRHAMDSLLELASRYSGRINAAAGPLANGKTWKRMEKARLEKAPQFPNGGHLSGCGCAGSSLAIDANGNINPCNMLAHIRLGRINRDSLRDVWLNHPELNDLRGRRQISLDSFEFCSGCEYIPYCTGNCPSAAFRHLGQVNHPSPDACLRNFLQQGGQIA